MSSKSLAFGTAANKRAAIAAIKSYDNSAIFGPEAASQYFLPASFTRLAAYFYARLPNRMELLLGLLQAAPVNADLDYAMYRLSQSLLNSEKEGILASITISEARMHAGKLSDLNLQASRAIGGNAKAPTQAEWQTPIHGLRLLANDLARTLSPTDSLTELKAIRAASACTPGGGILESTFMAEKFEDYRRQLLNSYTSLLESCPVAQSIAA